jgi:ABC-2 type transport system ATP-binding protein
MKPSSGSLHVLGSDLGESTNLREKVGVLTENSGLYSNLSALENLRFFGAIYSVKDFENKAKNLLNFVGLPYQNDQQAGSFSTGMKRKLSLAKSIINDPEVLFLDEPTAGLDPESQKMVRDLITDLATNKKITVFLTSHNLDEVQKICDHICIINKGEIVAEDTLANLQNIYSKSIFNIKFSSEEMSGKAHVLLKFKYPDLSIELIKDNINIINSYIETEHIIKTLIENNIEVKEAASQHSSLEEIYLNLVKN